MARDSARAAAHAFKRELILKAAAQLFHEHGYARTRVEDIASALGVTPPFIYYHFASKLDLLKQLCRQTSALAADYAEEALDPSSGPDFESRFRRFVRRFALNVCEERLFLSIAIAEAKHLAPETQAVMRGDRRRYHAALSRLLEEGRREGVFRFDHLSISNQTVTGMITWICNWYDPEGPETAEGVAERIETLVMNALGAGEGRLRQVRPGDGVNHPLDEGGRRHMLAPRKT